MSIHTVASAIIGAQKTHKRKDADFYPTPADVTLALLKHLKLPRGTLVREPACGTGEMAVVLEHSGLTVDASDLRRTGYGRGGVDFIAKPGKKANWVITNPPFNLALEFITTSLTVAPNVAMLLKSPFWHAASRRKFFEENPPYEILPLTWRPAFLEAERGKSPLMDVMWVVWRQESDGFCTYKPLPRPDATEAAAVPKPVRMLPADLLDLLGSMNKRRSDLESLL